MTECNGNDRHVAIYYECGEPCPLCASHELIEAYSSYRATTSTLKDPDVVDVTYTGEQWDKILRLRREDLPTQRKPEKKPYQSDKPS